MNMMIKDKIFEEERALYGAKDVTLENCAFRGEADGESALKESDGVCAKDTEFALRYPLWHAKNVSLRHVTMTDTCRAPLWYAERVRVEDAKLHGTKAVRECKDVVLENCDIASDEFGWFSSDIQISQSRVEGMYAFLRAEGLRADELHFGGKYSFQYLKNAEFSHCVFKTKDAFWHAENVTVSDSLIEGEYLGWYSRNLRLIRCHIKGTQPLCYAENLYLEDCTTEECDLSFEKSSVTANLRGHIDSIKAPASGEIIVDSVGAVLAQNDGSEGGARITVKGEK